MTKQHIEENNIQKITDESHNAILACNNYIATASSIDLYLNKNYHHYYYHSNNIPKQEATLDGRYHYQDIPYKDIRYVIANHIGQEGIVSNDKEILTDKELIEMSVTPNEQIIESDIKIKETVQKLSQIFRYFKHHKLWKTHTILQLNDKLQSNNNTGLLQNNNLKLLQLLLLDYAVVNKKIQCVTYIFVSHHKDNLLWDNRLSFMYDMGNVALYYATLNDTRHTEHMLESIHWALTTQTIYQRQLYSKAKIENTETETIVNDEISICNYLFDMLIAIFKIALSNCNLEIVNMSIRRANHYTESLLKSPNAMKEIQNQYPNYIKKLTQEYKNIAFAMHKNQEPTHCSISTNVIYNMCLQLSYLISNKDAKDVDKYLKDTVYDILNNHLNQITENMINKNNYADLLFCDVLHTSLSYDNCMQEKSDTKNISSKDAPTWKSRINGMDKKIQEI